MKYTARKYFLDFEKEEKWINEMSSIGMALTDYSWCRYVFEKVPEGKYLYRIELLENMPSHPQSAAYITFLEDNGIEVVATYHRWIYMRKLASEGSFDIYTDIDSKIKHMTRVVTIYNVLFGVEIGASFGNFIVGIISLSGAADLGNNGSMNIVLGGTFFMLSVLFFIAGHPIRKKLSKLRADKILHE